MDELKANIVDKEYSIIMVTELFPKNRVNINLNIVEFTLPGFTLYTADPATYNGRGIGIYVKDSITCIQIGNRISEGVESVQILIQAKDRDWLLVQCIYRSPSTGIESLSEIKRIFDYKSAKYNITHRLIAGDFNIKEIDWNLEMSTGGENHISTRFMGQVRDKYLYQHVRNYTRERAGTTPSILDLILTNEKNMIRNLENCSPLGNSDHMILIFELSLYLENHSVPRDKFLYFKGDYDTMSEELSKINWKELFISLSSNNAWDVFVETLINEMKKNIPVSKTTPKNYKTPWMKKESLTAIKEKRRRWNKYKFCRNEENRTRYTEAKRIASHEIKEAKITYERQIANNIKTDPESKVKTKDKIEAICDENGDLQHLDSEKVEILNNFFASVFTKENLEDLPTVDEKPTVNLLETVNIERETIRKHLSKLNTTKASGPDEMHPKLLRELSEVIDEPLIFLFKKNVDEGVLPQSWKNANVTAIFKKGDKSKPGNYRPISLTSVLIKILEKIIREAIVDHMNNNDFFSKHQHGFRSGLSCVTQLLEVIDDWTKMLDERKSIDVIYFDFQKAFDTVPHERLLEKLHSYGIRGKILRWIRDFLTNRKQRVILNGQCSKWTNVTSGIPQGSVLGPILFLIYINDLPDVVNNFIKLFADDTKIYAAVDVNTTLQEDVNRMSTWSSVWQLKFNESKCKHLKIGQISNTSYTIQTGEQPSTIEISEKEKDLGVTIDKNLNFQEHIYTQIAKANRILVVIRRTFKNLDKEMFLPLYKSLVRPHLEYASNVWYVIFKKEAVALENVQRRATKLVLEIQHLSYPERLKSLGIPSLEYRRLRSDMVETFKIINDIDKANKDQLFEIEADRRTRGHNFKLKKRHCRLNTRKFSFANRVISPWNDLAENFVNAKTVNNFKSKLNDYWKNKDIKFNPSCYTVGAGSDTNIIQTGRRVNDKTDFEDR